MMNKQLNELTTFQPGDDIVNWTVCLDEHNDLHQYSVNRYKCALYEVFFDMTPQIIYTKGKYFVHLRCRADEVELMVENMHILVQDEISIRFETVKAVWEARLNELTSYK